MSTQTINIAVVDGKKIVEATTAEPGQTGKAVRVKAVANGKYILAESESGVAPENITVRREGQDLHVALEGTDPSQPEIIIEGFFDAPGQLVGVAENGTYYPYVSSGAEGEAAFLMNDTQAPLVLGSEGLTGFGDGLYAADGMDFGWLWPLLLGLGGLGLLGVALADRNDDDKGGSADGGATVSLPELGSVEDNVGAKKGPIDNGGTTDDNRPTISGEGTPGNTIKIIVDDKLIGEVEVGEDGKWTFEPDVPLEDGKHEIVLIEKDPEGNESKPSDPHEIIVDTTAPGRATIDGATDDVGVITGEITNGGVTDDAQPAIRGTAEPGTTVIIYDDGKEIGRAPVDESGNWVFIPNPPLAEGTHNLTVAAEDDAGNIGLPSDTFTLEVDLTPPVKPGTGGSGGIDFILDDVGADQGDIGNGGTTDDARPELGGGSQNPGDTVLVYDNGTLIGSAQVAPDGSWRFPVTGGGLPNGEHRFTIIAQDPAGNQSAPSDEYVIIIDDTTPPGRPTIDGATDDHGVITGEITNGGVTDDAQPAVRGTAEPGSTVIIYDDGKEIGRVPVDDSGNWVFTPSPPLAEGPHNLTVTAEDAAGNVSVPSDTFTFDVDLTPPVKPGTGGSGGIDFILDDVGADQGVIGNGGRTDDAQPELGGGSQTPGDTVLVYDNGTLIGSVQVAPDGSWRFPVTGSLPDGEHRFTIIAQDPAGNQSAPSDEYVINVGDTTAPGRPTIDGATDDYGVITGEIANGGVTDDAQPAVRGTAEPGSTVIIYNGGTEIGRAPVDGSGNWVFTPSPPLAEGTYNLTAVAEDAAGNVSVPSDTFTFEVDLTAPVKPGTGGSGGIDFILDDVGADQGDIGNGGYTDDPLPELGGGSQAPGDTVLVYDNGALIGSAQVAPDGSWRFPVTGSLTEGEHRFTIIAQDPAGNQSAPSDEFVITTDYTTPAPPVITQLDDDQGRIQDPVLDGGVTDDTRPVVRGTTEAGTRLYIEYQQAGGTWSSPVEVTVNPDGSWSWTPPADLAEGDWSFRTQAVDRAGHTSAYSDEFTVEVDTTPPKAATSFSVSGDVVTVAFDNTDAAEGDVIEILAGGTPYKYTLTAADIAAGQADITAPGATMDNISVGLMDRAGNTGNHLVQVAKPATEDFDSRSPAQMGAGTYDLGLLNLTLPPSLIPTDQGILRGGVNYYGYVPPAGQNGLGINRIGAGETASFDLKGKNAENLKISMGNVHDAADINFYDQTGTKIFSQPLSRNVSGADDYDITMPAGMSFTKFVIVTSTGDFLWVDNIELSGGDIGYQFEEVPAPVTLSSFSSLADYEGTEGADVINISDVNVSDTTLSPFDAGTGRDELNLTGAGQILDLAALNGKMKSVEIINLTGSGDNTLKLSLNDVLASGEADLFFDSETDAKQMMIRGNEGDVVDLQGLSGSDQPGSWNGLGQVTVEGVTYDVYRHASDEAELLIQQGVQTNLM